MNYFVSKTGSNSNPGTESLPFLTPNKGISVLAPGDSLALRGGTFGVDDTGAFGGTQGTVEKPITIKAYPGEIPVIAGSRLYNTQFNLSGSYYSVEGITFDPGPSNISVALAISGKHITVKSSIFKNAPDTLIRLMNAEWINIDACKFDTAGSPNAEGTGDHIYVLGSHHVLIQNNDMTKAGHASVDVINSGDLMSHHVIIQKNKINQYWAGGLYSSRGSYDFVFQDNEIYYAGEGVLGYPKAGLHAAADNGIMRRNIVGWTGMVGQAQTGLKFAAYTLYGIAQHCRHNRVYNNTFYKTGYVPLDFVRKDIGEMSDNKFLNNIVFYCRTKGAKNFYSIDGNFYVVFDCYNASEKWPSFPNGNYFQGNILCHADSTGIKPGQKMMYYQTRDVATYSYTLAEAQSQFGQFINGNKEVDPQFVDAENKNFALRQGSPAIDSGVDLTKTTTAGSNVRQIPVDDPYFFCDGYGMIPGDEIQIGSTVTRIVSIDRAGKVLNVEMPVSFIQGAGVNLKHSGSRPDLGAVEYGFISTPSEPPPPIEPPPPPTPTPTTSPDGTVGTTITDAQAGVWTIGPSNQTLRNGTQMGSGLGTLYKYLGSVVYVRGLDTNWYKWTGSWVLYGPTEPGVVISPPPPPPPEPVPPPPVEPIPVPPPAPTPVVRKVAWPTGETKQNTILAQQWTERFRFKRHLSGAYAEFEKVVWVKGLSSGDSSNEEGY